MLIRRRKAKRKVGSRHFSRRLEKERQIDGCRVSEGAEGDGNLEGGDKGKGKEGPYTRSHTPDTYNDES